MADYIKEFDRANEQTQIQQQQFRQERNGQEEQKRGPRPDRPRGGDRPRGRGQSFRNNFKRDDTALETPEGEGEDRRRSDYRGRGRGTSYRGRGGQRGRGRGGWNNQQPVEEVEYQSNDSEKSSSPEPLTKEEMEYLKGKVEDLREQLEGGVKGSTIDF